MVTAAWSTCTFAAMRPAPEPSGETRRTRIAIALMVGGFVAGVVIGTVWTTPWSMIGIAISMIGYVMFSRADPH